MESCESSFRQFFVSSGKFLADPCTPVIANGVKQSSPANQSPGATRTATPRLLEIQSLFPLRALESPARFAPLLFPIRISLSTISTCLPVFMVILAIQPSINGPVLSLCYSFLKNSRTPALLMPG